MLDMVISGGQTGVDIAALDVAKALNIPTGGWAPRGWKTSIGPRPELASLYNMREHDGDYKLRTLSNIEDSNGTLICAIDFNSPGTKLTIAHAQIMSRPYFEFHLLYGQNTNEIVDWIRQNNISVLNVAGNRQPKSGRDIYTLAHNILTNVFTQFI